MTDTIYILECLKRGGKPYKRRQFWSYTFAVFTDPEAAKAKAVDLTLNERHGRTWVVRELRVPNPMDRVHKWTWSPKND